MKKTISIGTKVTFNSDDGPQYGTVADIKRNITNGQSIAFVQVHGTLNNTPWQIPVTELTGH